MKKYFDGITTFDELRKEYKRLALLNHPDRGGSTEVMQQINNEYDKLFIILKDRHNAEAPENKQMHEAPAAYREVLLRIITLKGIEIELCGSWIWLSGNTKEHKDELKSAGFFWAYKKLMWYWRPEEFKSFSRKSKSMDYIRSKYGSERITITEPVYIS